MRAGSPCRQGSREGGGWYRRLGWRCAWKGQTVIVLAAGLSPPSRIREDSDSYRRRVDNRIFVFVAAGVSLPGNGELQAKNSLDSGRVDKRKLILKVSSMLPYWKPLVIVLVSLAFVCLPHTNQNAAERCLRKSIPFPSLRLEQLSIEDR